MPADDERPAAPGRFPAQAVQIKGAGGGSVSGPG